MMSRAAECFASKIKCLKIAIQNELSVCTGSECLTWMNDCCLDLTFVCKYMHEFLSANSYGDVKNEMDSIFLPLRQLVSCVVNLERVSKIEQNENIILRICRRHFQERMIHCLSRLSNCISNGAGDDNVADINESNFVSHMDHALQLLVPLVLNFDTNSENATITGEEFLKSSQQIREYIELLLGQVLAFTCVVSKSDKLSLNTLCHRVMRACIEFQEICLYDDVDNDGTEYTENDKRLKAQQLQNALYSLDRLMNESYLRIFFKSFANFMEIPLKKIQMHKNQRNRRDAMNEMTETFDKLLDELIQIGNFGIAYSANTKAKSNLQSCLASFEAISISIIPAMVSSVFDRDTKYFQEIWDETIHEFRRSIQQIINTHALCTVLIDLLQQMLPETNKGEIDNINCFQSILNHCQILLEHIQVNSSELNLQRATQIRVQFEDFKMMFNECKVSLKMFGDIDVKRIQKRFNILLSAVKKMTKAIAFSDNQRKNDTQDLEEPFTFGHVTTPTDDLMAASEDEPIEDNLSESMNVIVDLNEFIEKNDDVKKELMQRSTVFYAKQTPRKFPKFSMASEDSTMELTLKRSATNVKRCSKRTSLRVAMFKRQKMLDTQKIMSDMTHSFQNGDDDSLNLQITDILEQLSRCTTGSSSE